MIILLSTFHALYSQNVAFNKLEKVALRSARKTGRPLVLIVNNIHFFKNDDEGRNMILQLQQKAEAWAASGTIFRQKEIDLFRSTKIIFRHSYHGF